VRGLAAEMLDVAAAAGELDLAARATAAEDGESQTDVEKCLAAAAARVVPGRYCAPPHPSFALLPSDS
jgi:Flp pilus assembly protein CpaB